MVWYVLVIEAIVFAVLFTTILFVSFHGEKIYSPACIHNYPPDIQEEYFKTHERVDVSYKSKKVVLAKSCGIIMFTVILTICAKLAGAVTFGQGFAIAFGLMVWIGAYDTLFLDWVLFANMKMFRLEGTEHMDKAYHQKWFHLKGAIFPGLLFALIPAAIVGLFISLMG
ncbi:MULTISPECIES: hypothetical protein [Butyrivibrio]|uniref:hypothetical protein n=1 Tax=Butyrivibrio TaxID=830 RepID=UPI0003B55491|nr:MULTISPECIES: hypothetical protein [Butyrivibrio]